MNTRKNVTKFIKDFLKALRERSISAIIGVVILGVTAIASGVGGYTVKTAEDFIFLNTRVSATEGAIEEDDKRDKELSEQVDDLVDAVNDNTTKLILLIDLLGK